jgi:hypothetical protein
VGLTRFRRAAGLILAFLLSFSGGCALVGAADPSSNTPTRGKLSDAAEQAKKPPEEQDPIPPAPEQTDTAGDEPSSTKRKQGETDEDHEPGGDEVVVVPAQLEGGVPIATVAADSVAADSSTASRTTIFAGPVAGFAYESGGLFDRIDVVGLEIGGGREGDPGRLVFEIVHARFRVKSSHHLDDALHDVTELGFGVAGRYFLTPAHTALGAYLVAGYRLALVEWKWRNPVAGLEGDSIDTHSGYVGLGFIPVHTEYLHIGANLTGGYRVFVSTTSEGFENDLFDDVWLSRLMFEAVYVH